MTVLAWSHSNPRYELGIDRGVLYPAGSAGVAWNGLISVSEDPVGGERNEYYRDGDKFTETVNSSIYSATIKAFTAPKELGPCVGERDLVTGFTITGQPKIMFGLSYRTRVGANFYKLHLVYNISARNSARAHKTAGGSSEAPSEFEWKVDAVPFLASGFAPTAHLVIDSSRASADDLAAIENLLYGNFSADPTLPDPATVIALFKS